MDTSAPITSTPTKVYSSQEDKTRDALDDVDIVLASLRFDFSAILFKSIKFNFAYPSAEPHVVKFG